MMKKISRYQARVLDWWTLKMYVIGELLMSRAITIRQMKQLPDVHIPDDDWEDRDWYSPLPR